MLLVYFAAFVDGMPICVEDSSSTHIGIPTCTGDEVIAELQEALNQWEGGYYKLLAMLLSLKRATGN
jgi:hypothetical protein